MEDEQNVVRGLVRLTECLIKRVTHIQRYENGLKKKLFFFFFTFRDSLFCEKFMTVTY